MVAGLGQRFLALRERHGGRKISVLGWSLGGIYARELARRFPADVRQVITLASPFRDPEASNVPRFFRRPPADDGHEVRGRLRAPLPVPSSSIYSRSDGIVAWRSCLQDDGPLSENIEVLSSHCGMGHHPRVLLVIADRLAQPEDAWRPYGAGGRA
jgi:pimeloyl-ACP methyl ester carboxylesterase